MSEGIRAAVIGCGDISALHLAAISSHENASLVALSDIDPGRLAVAADVHGVPGFADHLQLLDEIRPDVVHICTPHNTHAALAIDALDRGISVVLEKPVAHTRDEATRLMEAASRSSARIAVCFQNRYNAPVQAAFEILSSGAAGQVTGAAATVIWHRSPEYYQDRPWRGRWSTGGGGLLMNQAIHTLDLVQWLVGPVVKVRGSASTRLLDDVIEVEDTAEMVLTHESGARSVFYTTLAHVANAPVSLEIVAEKATLSLRGDLTIAWADGRRETVSERALPTGERAYWGVSHELLIADFYAHLDDGGAFWIDPEEARKSLDIIQDVYDQSYPERAGRTETTTERKTLT
ncbi:Gfo/Idh/MocA family protein [Mycetocola zhadangensis]|uniref:Gfo/Idh/MocA family oxidoreductase n=1 Tax=Mycetocola zhadangensis TaxID=1164595 RepID=A0A3L7J4T8_9MICO|nr:Gfo/Idh/MocA family oxidoreductase [Mycetocola zhadangensis]RLQ85613.1 gfo/Idh/MocA family oxidoreductase [Mycetocola zhadangensis]GGE84123.1 dehydrogenase [Mycetocola zhadangensis]